MILDKNKECINRHELEEIQSDRLKKIVKYVYNNVKFYREKFDGEGIDIDRIKGIEDLAKLPFTSKEDLRDNYPYKLFAVPMEKISRIHASSGTTGKPVVVGYTNSDLDLWKEVVARSLSAYGITKEDIIHVSYGYGLFTGGLGLNNGGEQLGATIIPVSSGNTKKQIQILEDFGSTAIACTPSYALHIADIIEKEDIDRSKLKLKVGIFGAEPWTEAMRKQLKEKLNIKPYDIYGLSEIIGPGVSFECEELDGLHINEDYFLPEIIDPVTLEVLEEGKSGELVITTITKEGIPLIRYRTRDITKLNYKKCKCGRTLVRMEKCLARSDDMIIIRGVNIYPTQVESVLLESRNIEPHYLLVVDRVNNLDTLEILVEGKEELHMHGQKKIDEVSSLLKSKIQSVLGVSVKLNIVLPNTLERSSGKIKRVIDNRKICNLE